MFFVYGTSGQLFKGSMEQLRQIHGVGALARVRGVAPVGRDGQEVSEELGVAFLPSDRLSAPQENAPHAASLAAYAQAQQGANPRRPLSRVADVMNRQPITLPDSATILKAWQLLAEKAIGQAPVLDADGKLVGLLTRADLLKPDRLPSPERSALVWLALMQQNVKDIMVTPVPSVAEDADLRRVAQVLLDTGLPGLPVADDQGHVSGFISRSDILRAVVHDPPLDLWS